MPVVPLLLDCGKRVGWKDSPPSMPEGGYYMEKCPVCQDAQNIPNFEIAIWVPAGRDTMLFSKML